MTSPEPNPDLSPIRRACYLALGWWFVVLASAGVILPVLPTTPFLLLASFFFVRSSPKTYRWLLRSRLFGPFLRDWHEHRAVRRSVKFTAATVLMVVVALSIISNRLSTLGLIILLTLSAIGLTVVLLLPVIPTQKPQTIPTDEEPALPPG